jgi:copper chaperone CopZ
MSRLAARSLAAALVIALAACGRDERPGAASGPATAPSAVAPAAVAPAAVAPPRRAPPAPASLARVTIKALGMNCEESCPVKVRAALAGVASVYELGFDLSTESIFVSYDASLGPAKQVTKPMIAAIKAAGYDPWLAKESWPDGATVQVLAR